MTTMMRQEAGANSPDAKSPACDYCGLPTDGPLGSDEPRYCCYGCRFAASITAADGDEGQARWAMTRLGLAIFFSMNVMVFTMVLWAQPAESADQLAGVWYDLARYACLLFTLPVVLLLGAPLLHDAVAESCRGRASLSVLLSVGVTAALSYSIFSLLVDGGHIYFEVACTILVAVTLGRWLEASGKLQTTAAMRGLKQLLPDSVRLLCAGAEQVVAASQLVRGDSFRVLPGERVSADGQVICHEAAVDEQAVTGESLPVVRRPGDHVLSGSLVLDGPLDIRATAPAGEGTLARAIAAVTAATQARTKYERLAEQISRWLLPAIAIIALVTLAVHAMRGNPAGGLLAALAVLVIACPCALGLATPMALWAAIGRAAQAGVLIRDGDALSILAKARTVCFDKTGTLTTGEAAVQDLRLDATASESVCLSMARALSRMSSHPLAEAIARYAEARANGIEDLVAEQLLMRAGRGIAGRVGPWETSAFLGSRAWLADCGQAVPVRLLPGEGCTDDGAAETLVAWDGRARGRFTFREDLRPEAEGTIALLRALGLAGVMLTGDRELRARTLAESLGIDHRSKLLPADKLMAIHELQVERGPVVMVGDGINDAPALAAADVGVALASGTDISRQSAGVCLLTSDLARLPWLVGLARQTERTIRWNLVWAFGYNLAGIALAAAGWLHPIVAAIAMGLSSLLVITNSLSLARFPLDEPAQEGGA
jgi:heavy metal translocating P-type ATPase